MYLSKEYSKPQVARGEKPESGEPTTVTAANLCPPRGREARGRTGTEHRVVRSVAIDRHPRLA